MTTSNGGGAGMVLMIEPIDDCISKLKSQRDYDEVIYMTPDGETFAAKNGQYNVTIKEHYYTLWALQRG